MKGNYLEEIYSFPRIITKIIICNNLLDEKSLEISAKDMVDMTKKKDCASYLRLRIWEKENSYLFNKSLDSIKDHFTKSPIITAKYLIEETIEKALLAEGIRILLEAFQIKSQSDFERVKKLLIKIKL